MDLVGSVSMNFLIYGHPWLSIDDMDMHGFSVFTFVYVSAYTFARLHLRFRPLEGIVSFYKSSGMTRNGPALFQH